MGLRLKILSGFTILAIMLCLAGVWSVYELSSIGSSVQCLLDDNYKSINAAKKMLEAVERKDSGVLVLLLGQKEEGRSIIMSADSLFLEGLETAEGNITLVGEEELVAEIRSKYEVYKKQVAAPIVGTKYEGNLDWYLNEIHQAFLELKTTIEKLMTINDRAMYETASELKDRARRAVMPGIIAILSALVFTFMFNYFINYYVVSPILKMTEGIDKVITKRLPFSVKIESKDELLHLSDSIRKLSNEIALAEKNSETSYHSQV